MNSQLEALLNGFNLGESANESCRIHFTAYVGTRKETSSLYADANEIHFAAETDQPLNVKEIIYT